MQCMTHNMISTTLHINMAATGSHIYVIFIFFVWREIFCQSFRYLKCYSSFLNLATGTFSCSRYLATVRRAML